MGLMPQPSPAGFSDQELSMCVSHSEISWMHRPIPVVKITGYFALPLVEYINNNLSDLQHLLT